MTAKTAAPPVRHARRRDAAREGAAHGRRLILMARGRHGGDTPAQQNTGAGRTEPATAPPPPLPLVTAKDLLDGLKNPSRWLTYSGDYTGQRHGPLRGYTHQRVAPFLSVDVQAEACRRGRGFEGRR
jgi:hypothetical protein